MSTVACSVRPALPQNRARISVNGVAIPRDAISREAQNHPAARPFEAWMAAARALCVRELLLQEAKRLQLDATPACDDEGRRETMDEALIRTLLETQVHVPAPSTEECRRYYDANRARFTSPAILEVRHILVPRGDDAEAARGQAQNLIAALAAGASFAGLAEEFSACPSAKTGGSLGQISTGDTVPEFESALDDLPEGTVAPQPIETRYGFHVVEVLRRIAPQELPFDAVRDTIAAFLPARSRMMAERQYVEILAGQAAIEGIALSGTATPLVQ